MKRLFFLITSVLFGYIMTGQAEALRMSNNDYILRSDVNSFGGVSEGERGKIISSSSGAPGMSGGTNYKILTQTSGSENPFTFSISTHILNFGDLIPGEPITREHILTVDNSPMGYQIMAEENHPLRALSSNLEIPNTTCDTGNCSAEAGEPWTSPLTYGLGFRCDNVAGHACLSTFELKSIYKQLPNMESGKLPQIIAKSDNLTKRSQTKITYKVNVSASQAKGIYQNIIKYIASPSL